MNTNKLASLTCLLLMSMAQLTLAQGNKRMVLVGLDFYKATNSSSIVKFAGGLNAAYHKPLQKNLVFIGRAGLNYYKAESYYVGTGYGVTGNPSQVLPTPYSTFNEVSFSALTLPLTVGLRQYVTGVAQGAHADVGIGAEIGIHNATMVLLFAPGVGYMLPLSGGKYLDFNLSLPTSFKRGGTAIGIGIALGLPR